MENKWISIVIKIILALLFLWIIWIWSFWLLCWWLVIIEWWSWYLFDKVYWIPIFIIWILFVYSWFKSMINLFAKNWKSSSVKNTDEKVIEKKKVEL